VAPNSEKDRLGDKLKDLEHAREDLFFAERDRELIEKLRAQAAHAWRAEVIDFAALVRAVADGRAPLAALQVDQAFLDDQAAQAGEALALPGVRAVKNDAR
jgi:hypothetical protein